jgi:hypothetical protein
MCQIELLYGFDNELIVERYTVAEVLAVLQDQFRVQEALFDDDEAGK